MKNESSDHAMQKPELFGQLSSSTFASLDAPKFCSDSAGTCPMPHHQQAEHEPPRLVTKIGVPN